MKPGTALLAARTAADAFRIRYDRTDAFMTFHFGFPIQVRILCVIVGSIGHSIINVRHPDRYVNSEVEQCAIEPAIYPVVKAR
jgi:hypothetical protein